MTAVGRLSSRLRADAAGEQTARDRPDGPRITVKFGDIDLNTTASRSELLNRLSKAADRGCREYAQLHSSLGCAGVCVSRYRHSLGAAVDMVHPRGAIHALRDHVAPEQVVRIASPLSAGALPRSSARSPTRRRHTAPEPT